MLVLADSDGVLIEAIGDKKTLHDGMDIHLAIGGKWNEGAVGTNGIGTALWTGEPIFVHAAEHFCAGIKGWTCAGAPIRDPLDGKIVGVVDLSGYSPIFRPHNTALVAATARQIEKALAEQQQEQRTRLLEAFISSAPGYRGKDGLVIVDHRGRAIFCNNVPNGDTAEMTDGPMEPGRGRWLMNLPASGSDNDLAKALPAHLRSCHITPLKLDGNLSGAALVFPAAPIVSGVAAINREADKRLQAATSMIVGESEKVLAAVDVASRVARSSGVTSLLIEGETGVGKELFARLVHAGSQRSDTDPFVALNCGAITRELFGSELFGHVAGAFTGASRDGKAGVFEQANGGVLSLDEIGELPLEIQPFLLRVLEERVVHRIGDSRGRPVDVRLVASTNRDLKQEVAAGRFRSDLYYRIGAVSIRVPALRERGEDVLLLVEHFNRQIAAKAGNDPLQFSTQALDALLAYRWPGNVRELKNMMERLHILARDSGIDLQDLPSEITTGHGSGTMQSDNPAAMLEAPVCTFEDAERQAIRNALAAEGGNLSKVALRLGISRPTLYRKLEQYGIRRGFV
ncbi:sigma-54-dependent Fis family transcriptional regulator [Mesorhizobium sp. B2-8-5]|uniref:sigma-54-dependent Fis family transcriptional regulator n=1 Tax=Mesorhizobium sp. B2-8-5 TaxID=2589903 RepID=UPI0039B12853